jgi:dolichol-phosphate mannosyltransferase
VVEEPFTFAERQAGESKATFSQGLRFLSQLTALRFGKLSGFAVIGAIGALANLVIMAVLQAAGVWYLSSAIIAAVVTIVANFLLQERFIFGDLTAESRSTAQRFALSFGFNATETVVRTTALWAIVEATSMPSLVVQAVLIAIGFLARFVYHSRVVYRPRPRADRAADAIEDSPYPADHAHRTE